MGVNVEKGTSSQTARHGTVDCLCVLSVVLIFKDKASRQSFNKIMDAPDGPSVPESELKEAENISPIE